MAKKKEVKLKCVNCGIYAEQTDDDTQKSTKNWAVFSQMECPNCGKSFDFVYE